MPLLPVAVGPFEHTAAVAVGLLVYAGITRIRQQRRSPAAAMAWVLAMLALPYVALPLFVLFGTRKLKHAQSPRSRPPSKAQQPHAQEAPRWATQLLHGLGAPPPLPCECVHIHPQGPQALSALLQVIAAARHELLVCTFVLGDDAVGHTVVNALAAQVQRGVQVRVMVDALGSLRTLGRMSQLLRQHGVQVMPFAPLRRRLISARSNMRMHRKLVVADRRLLWSGGRNLAREYFLDDCSTPAWVDLSFVLLGPVAEQAAQQFERDWAQEAPLRLLAPRLSSSACQQQSKKMAVSSQNQTNFGGKLNIPKFNPERDAPTPQQQQPLPRPTGIPAPRHTHIPSAPPTLAQWLATGPDQAFDTLHALLVTAAHQAQTRLAIATPYFVPDEPLLDALCLACLRGVRVTVLVPARSNHALADLARPRALRQLMAMGAQVWCHPAMLHAKLIVVDDTLALCGSLNLDNRSLFINHEAMCAFYGRPTIHTLCNWFEQQVRQSQAASPQTPNWARKTLEDLVRLIGFQL